MAACHHYNVSFCPTSYSYRTRFLLKVNVSVKQGIPIYSVTYKDKTILEDSPLGFVANVGDFSRDMTFTGQKENKIDKTYTQDRIKQSQIHYQANELTCTFTNKEKKI